MANRLRDLVSKAYDDGRYEITYIRKVPAIASTASVWSDLSMSTGHPRPNFYVGDELSATVPTGWYKKGIFHGGNVSPYRKYLHKIMLYSSGAALAPAPFILCDYLMYYPLIDMDSTDTQTLDNTTASLPRYTDGKGVYAFLVATQPYAGGVYLNLSYTNHLGQSGRTTEICALNTSSYIGQIVNCNPGAAPTVYIGYPFFLLQAGDLGMRSIENITFQASCGGLGALVLVRPIATVMTRDTTAWSEFDFIKDKPSVPIIQDGAYLNFITQASASILTVPLLGEITTIWGD